jgi:pimeloyl-ACP methyl ester carboxylesterase
MMPATSVATRLTRTSAQCFSSPGEHDVFAPRAVIDAYASRVSVAQTVEVAGGGHDIHVTHTLIFERKVLS